MKTQEKTQKKAEARVSLEVAARHWETLADNAEGAAERLSGRDIRALVAVSERAGRVAAPAEPALAYTAGQTSRLRQAEVLRSTAAGLRADVEAQAAKRNSKGRTKAQRLILKRAEGMEAQAVAVTRSVEAERAAQIEARALAASASVTEALAKRRDEDPVVETVSTGEFARDAHGGTVRGEDGLAVFLGSTVERVRIAGRDGLLLQFEGGRLDAAEYEAGRNYRSLTEQASGGLGSQLGAVGEGGGAGGDRGERFHLVAHARAKAGIVRSEIDRAVALELKAQPWALTALRRVAGEGATVSALAGGSARERERLGAGLKAALKVAARILKLRYPGQLWVAEGCERGGIERPFVAAPVREEHTTYVDEAGERLFEAVRRPAKKPG